MVFTLYLYFVFAWKCQKKVREGVVARYRWYLQPAQIVLLHAPDVPLFADGGDDVDDQDCDDEYDDDEDDEEDDTEDDTEDDDDADIDEEDEDEQEDDDDNYEDDDDFVDLIII